MLNEPVRVDQFGSHGSHPRLLSVFQKGREPICIGDFDIIVQEQEDVSIAVPGRLIVDP